MQARIKIINKLTKQVQIMSDKSDEEWAVQNGYSKELHEVEEAFDGKWYLQGYAPEQSMKKQLEIIRTQKIEEAKQAYTSAIQKITPDYPPDEKLSFDKQEAQALLYKQNPEIDESQILFIANLAKDKQEDLAVLVEKILQKKTQFEIYSAKYLGRKQRVEQLCKNAQTAEEAEAIDVAAIFNEPLE